jgi:hypothetical protein
MSEEPAVSANAAFTQEQREGLGLRRADDDQTLAAIHELERALAQAASGRELAWGASVIDALHHLIEATATEQANADQPESLLSDIARTQPRLRSRVRGLRAQYRQIRNALTALVDELGQPEEQLRDFGDVRQRLSWILTALRHQQARESDLIYEAYHEAFDANLDDEAPSDRLP